jgi:hypothetical protein
LLTAAVRFLLIKKKPDQKIGFFLGRGCRNRTYANGFGDRRTTTIRIPLNRRGRRDVWLFGFLVLGVLLAPLAKLFHHQPVLVQFLIFPGMIVDVVTDRAFHLDQIVL